MEWDKYIETTAHFERIQWSFLFLYRKFGSTSAETKKKRFLNVVKTLLKRLKNGWKNDSPHLINAMTIVVAIVVQQ